MNQLFINNELYQQLFLNGQSKSIEIQEKLINPIEYLNYPKFELNNTEKEKVSHGNPITIDAPNGICVLKYNSEIIAMANVENKIAKILKVFI